MMLVTEVGSYEEEEVSVFLVEQAFLSRVALESYPDTLTLLPVVDPALITLYIAVILVLSSTRQQVFHASVSVD